MTSPLEAHDAVAELQAGLAQIWARSRGRHLESIDVAITFLGRVVLGEDPPMEPPIEAVHRLAGNLGMFGLDHAARLATQLETLLRAKPTVEPMRAHQLLVIAEDIRLMMEDHTPAA